MQAIIELKKRKLFLMKPVDEPENSVSVLKSLSVFMSRGKLVKPGTEITVQGRLS